MEFDRKGPEGGLEIYVTIENAKVLLEFKAYLKKAPAEIVLEEAMGVAVEHCKEAYLDIRMWDREDREVFCCRHPLIHEELAKGLMLHAHLWQGIKNPYLYRVRVSLMEKENFVADVIEDMFALRTFREIPGKGWYLNNELFTVRAVAYVIPTALFLGCIVDKNERKARIRRDLDLILNMGANTICPVGGEMDREFWQICNEKGLLVWWQNRTKSPKSSGLVTQVQKRDLKIPEFYGTDNSLLSFHGHYPTEQYYYYKACWSKEPFVYISAESLSFQKSGNARVLVYSNQRKVALYVEGVLFEFKSDGPEFLFEEIPVKRLPLMLIAEADECSMAVTAFPVHRNFTE